MLECSVKVLEGKRLDEWLKNFQERGIYKDVWSQRVKTFTTHVDTQQRASTVEGVLNDPTDGITSKWTSSSLCHWPPKGWHNGHRNRRAMVPGMGTMYGPSSRGSDSSLLI